MPLSLPLLMRRGRAMLADPLLRGFGAFGSAELANRGVRLVTTIIIARQLAPDIVGEAALALTLFELIRVLNSIGVGQRIIAAKQEDLDAVCNMALRLFWIWSGVLVAVQLAIAALLYGVFDHAGPAAKLAALSMVYLLMPAGLVQCFLAMRDGLNARLARTAATQAISDHLLTALLLLIWPNAWSIILPKILTAPIWLIMTRHNRPWHANRQAGYACWRSMIRYGGGVLAADGLTALRQQGDNLIIAATMGSSALGAYFFAYNAGLGIFTSLVGGFGTVSFPMLCAAEAGAARQRVLRKIVGGALLLFLPLIAAQSLLAPYYVPLIFGEHWRFAAPLIAILCLAGFAQLASVLTANWLRAEGRVRSDAGRSLISCICALGGLYLGTLTGSLFMAVIGLVAGTLLAAGLAAAYTLGPALRRFSPPSPHQEQLA